MSEPALDIDFPLWATLSIIGASVALMLFSVACCAVRCFRPENSKGSSWFPSKDGKEQYARGLFQESDGKSGFVRKVDGGAGGGAAGAGAGAVTTSSLAIPMMVVSRR